MSLQAKIDALVNQRIESAVNAAIDKALGGNGGDTKSNPAASLKTEAPAGGNSTCKAIQDLADVARRAIRYSKGNKAFSKNERVVAKNVIKAVKSQFKVIATGADDVWKANGC